MIEDVQFVERLGDLSLKRLLLVQDPADLPLEAGNTGPQPFHMLGGIPDFRNFYPEKFIRIQFHQFIESIANVPQGIEPLSICGKRFQLCLYNAQLTFKGLAFLVDFLDMSVQWHQFLC